MSDSFKMFRENWALIYSWNTNSLNKTKWTFRQSSVYIPIRTKVVVWKLYYLVSWKLSSSYSWNFIIQNKLSCTFRQSSIYISHYGLRWLFDNSITLFCLTTLLPYFFCILRIDCLFLCCYWLCFSIICALLSLVFSYGIHPSLSLLSLLLPFCCYDLGFLRFMVLAVSIWRECKLRIQEM